MISLVEKFNKTLEIQIQIVTKAVIGPIEAGASGG